VLSREWDHHRRVLGTLRLVNRDRISGDDLIKLAEVVIDQPAIEIDHQLLGFQVNRLNEPKVTIKKYRIGYKNYMARKRRFGSLAKLGIEDYF
jgi:hypothetical protein